jgi:hypothetical protein
VPDGQRQRQCTQTVGQNSRFAAMDLPTFPDRNGAGQQHHDASNAVHAHFLSEGFFLAEENASILGLLPDQETDWGFLLGFHPIRKRSQLTRAAAVPMVKR